MYVSEAGRQASARLWRMRSVLWASVVETKLRRLERAFKANFDSNQPRVPAGNPDGGQWIGSGGGGSERVAQMPPRGGRGRGTEAEATPAQLARRDIAEARAGETLRRVRDIDPTWSPRQSLTAPNSVEGQIARAQAIAVEAEARLRELARQPAESLIDSYRQQQGLDLLGEPVWSRDANSVALCTVDEVPYVGTNSQALTYTNADRLQAEQLRDAMLEKYPDTMSTESVGQFPNDALFHAEVTCLLRAARANGGTLEGRIIEMSVDRVMCPSCRTMLPSIGLELGNPTVRFVDPKGSVRTMRDGTWK